MTPRGNSSPSSSASTGSSNGLDDFSSISAIEVKVLPHAKDSKAANILNGSVMTAIENMELFFEDGGVLGV